MEWVESTGETIELAKEHALDRLGVHEDDAEFDVLCDVKTGCLVESRTGAGKSAGSPKTPRAKEAVEDVIAETGVDARAKLTATEAKRGARIPAVVKRTDPTNLTDPEMGRLRNPQRKVPIINR